MESPQQSTRSVVVDKEKRLLLPASISSRSCHLSIHIACIHPSIQLQSNAIQIPQQSHPESNNLAVDATNRKGKNMRIMFIRRTAVCVLQEGIGKWVGKRMGCLYENKN